jgi:hypothetical protein
MSLDLIATRDIYPGEEVRGLCFLKIINNRIPTTFACNWNIFLFPPPLSLLIDTNDTILDHRFSFFLSKKGETIIMIRTLTVTGKEYSQKNGNVDNVSHLFWRKVVLKSQNS